MPRPNKKAKYTRIIPIRFTDDQWLKIQVQAQKDKLDSSVWIRKTSLDKINDS